MEYFEHNEKIYTIKYFSADVKRNMSEIFIVSVFNLASNEVDYIFDALPDEIEHELKSRFKSDGDSFVREQLLKSMDKLFKENGKVIKTL